jgi:6-phosphogluconolactonase
MKTTLPLLAASLMLANTYAAGDHLVYFGCYTNGKSTSKGIQVATFNSTTGELSEPELAAEMGNPSFLAFHPSKPFLYAVGEMSSPGRKGGTVTAFSILPTGKLQRLNQVSSVGEGPCHISLDRTGKMAMVANYSGGSVASFALQADHSLTDSVSFFQHTGSGPNTNRQSSPHAHSINPSPDNRFALACDLGNDQVLVYAIDPASGKMTAHGSGKVPSGSGPRHLAFHPNGKWVFVNNEITLTETTFAYDAEAGKLTEVETVSTLPAADRDKKGFSTAETVVHPNGKFVYVSNRTHDTLAVFQCDPATGKLTLLQNVSVEGKIPRNFNLDPSGNWMIVALQDSGYAAVFKVDPEKGTVTFTGKKVPVGGAVCVRFLPLERTRP